MELKQIMKDAGLVGDGGAGFPSYAKLGEGADTLVINGAECEPLLYTDYIIMQRELPLVLAGIQAVIWSMNIPRALFCIKKHTAERLSFTDGEKLGHGVFVKILPDVYPMGDEISLIFEATGRVVRPGSLPISKRVIVYNVETMYNLGRTIKFGEPVTMKWLTVGGDIEKPRVVKVPIGTRVEDLFKKLGIEVGEGRTVLEGGPSMGRIINYRTASVSKVTKALIVLPDDTQAVMAKLLDQRKAAKRAETACCQCTRCTDMCPRNLLGYPLEPHKLVRTAMNPAEISPDLVINATLCCACGVCESLACNQGISPRAVIAGYKALLGKNKMKYVSEVDVFPREEREYRMIHSDKWAYTLGVKKFDRVAEFAPEIKGFDRVEIPLGKYIGALPVPIVKDGDTVKKGDLIAQASAGLSVPFYATIDGRVTVAEDKIIIDRIG